MTSGPSGTLVAELTQSRKVTSAEALAIFRADVALFRRRVAAVRGYQVRRIALLAVLVGFFAFLIFGGKMHWIPRVSPLLFVPTVFLIAFGICRIWSRYYWRICAGIYQECRRADHRFRIEAEGIVTSASGIVSSIPWSAISDIVADKDYLTIHLSPISAISLPKAACEGQDVDGFCAELVRRWRQNRDSSQSEPAP